MRFFHRHIWKKLGPITEHNGYYRYVEWKCVKCGCRTVKFFTFPPKWQDEQS